MFRSIDWFFVNYGLELPKEHSFLSQTSDKFQLLFVKSEA